MALVALLVLAVLGLPTYAYLHAIGISTAAEERLGLVVGVALALVLQPQTGAEFVIDLVIVGGAVLSIAMVAHLALILVSGWRRGPSSASRRA